MRGSGGVGRAVGAGRRWPAMPRPALGLGRDATFLFWGMFVFEFGFGLYNTLLTLYIKSLGATDFQIGMLIGAQGILRIAIPLPSGVIADRVSRRRLIVVTTALTVPAIASYGLAQTWWQLLPGMIVIVFGNVGTPAFSSYIADASAGGNRARAFSLIYTVGPSVALILAPATGGWLADRTALRVLFFVSAVAYLLATVVFSRISERPRALHEGSKTGYREAFRIPAVRAVGLLQLGVLAALTTGTTLLPNYLKDVHGLGLATVGRFGSVAAVGSVMLAVATGRSAWLTSSRAIGVATLAVGGVCAVTLLSGRTWVLTPAFLMRGGFIVAWSLFPAVLGDVTPPVLRNRAFALAEFLGGIGFGLAPFAAGALSMWHPGAPLLVAAIVTPLLAGAAVWIERRYVRPAVRARLLEQSRWEDDRPTLPEAVIEAVR